MPASTSPVVALVQASTRSPGSHLDARDASANLTWPAHGQLAQAAAVLLERHQLAEHPVVVGRLVDGVGALEPRLELGDPAQGGELLEAVDVARDERRVGLLGGLQRLDAERADRRLDDRVGGVGADPGGPAGVGGGRPAVLLDQLPDRAVASGG